MESFQFNQLADWAQSMVDAMAPQQRKQIARKMAVLLRRQNQQRLTKQTGPDGEPWAPRKNKRTGSVARKRKMMQGLKKARFLRIQSDNKGASVGYNARTARIAAIHHFGLTENGIEYDERKLLGITEKDLELLASILVDKMVSG